MALPEGRKIKILALWGASHFEGYFTDLFLNHDRFEVEIVSGDRSSGPSPHAASWSRLFDLRRRVRGGDFDLVISGPIQNSAWPVPKRLATCLAQAARFFTYKHRMLDTWWAPWLVSGTSVPLAVVDFLDTAHLLARDFRLLKASTLYFKINLYFWPRRSLVPAENLFGQRRVIVHAPKLRPFTNGVADRAIPATARPMAERDIDLCFTGTIVPARSPDDPNPFPELTANPIRKEIFQRCARLQDRYRVFCANKNVERAEYLELLQRSKLVVCTESFGCETWRHYDAAAAGAIPLINWPYTQNYLPLEPDKHAIYFSLFGDDFERTIERALADPAKLAQISVATREFTVGRKQRRQIAEWLVEETLRQHAGGKS